MSIIGIPPLISRPDILAPLSAAGHGSLIVIADAGFPAEDHCYSGLVAYGNGRIKEFLNAILQVRSLDDRRYYDDKKFPIFMMSPSSCDEDQEEIVDGHNKAQTVYAQVIRHCTKQDVTADNLNMLDRADFYCLAEEAALVIKVVTDTTPYGNIAFRLAAS